MAVKNPDLIPLFDEMKVLIEPFAEYFTVRRDEPGAYELWSERDIVIDGRKRHEVFFAGLLIQKSYVGFYFMPVYAEPEMRRVFGSELLALLRGKSCFHIKRLTPEISTQVKDALVAGYELYVQRGWV